MEAKGLLDKLKASFTREGDGKNRLIIGAGLLGMVLILFSSFWGGKEETVTPADAAMMTSAQYEGYMEERLERIVSSIEGVGEAKVMVTLEHGVEYVYAREEKQNTDLLQDFGSEGGSLPRKVQEKNSNQVNYILVEGSGGKKQALVEQQVEPQIQGVVVLCQGAGSAVVQQRVTDALKTVLDLPANRICVTKIRS